MPVAGFPGLGTAYVTTPFAPTGGEQLLATPTASQVDLYDGEVLVSAALTGIEPLSTLSADQAEAMIADIAARRTRAADHELRV